MRYKDYTKKWEKVFVGRSFGNGYGGIYRNKKWIRDIVNPVIQNIDSEAAQPVFIADIGCGSGILGLNALHALAGHENTFLHCIDVNVDQLDGITSEAKKLSIAGNFHAVNSNLFDIAYPENFFSGMVGRLFLHHLTHEDNSRFWQFIANKLKSGGVASIYTVVAPDKSVANFIRTVYEWRAEKVGVDPQGFIPTSSYVKRKLSFVEGISYNIIQEVRGPLYVSGKASIQEKTGLGITIMGELENIFRQASVDIKRMCRIREIPHGKIKTHEFFWPCQLIVIKKE